MQESSVAEIKRKLGIVDLVGSYVKLEKAGLNYRACCPFHHEKTPSFFVSPARASYHCFGCNRGGDIFSFVEEVEGVEFREALTMLADKAGVVLANFRVGQSSEIARLREILTLTLAYYQEQLTKNKLAGDYLKERGLLAESINAFHIGFAPALWSGLTDYLRLKKFSSEELEKSGLAVRGEKGVYDRFRGRIMFPFFDYSGRVIGFSGRILPNLTENVGQEQMGKYINSPETPLFHKSQVFYGFDRAKKAIKEKDKAILVEGQLDVVMAHQAGTTNVVGVSGTALSDEHLKIISRLTENVTIILDGDTAGFKASDRAVRMALASGLFVSVVKLPPGDDPASCIARDKTFWHKALGQEQAFINYALDTIAIETTVERERHAHVREHLYPHLLVMSNAIEKDKYMQAIGPLVGASDDAVRQDFAEWLRMAKDSENKIITNKVKALQDQENFKYLNLPPVLVLLAKRIWGIIYFEEQSQINFAHPLRDNLAEMLSNLYNILDTEFLNKKDDLIFQTELYYPELVEREREKQDLFARLRQEYLKHEFSQAMQGLREAEVLGDSVKISKWLMLCQEITSKLAVK